LYYDEYTRAYKVIIGYLNCNFSENKNTFVNFKMFKIFGGQDKIKRIKNLNNVYYLNTRHRFIFATYLDSHFEKGSIQLTG